MPDSIIINNHVTIPRSELHFQFARGGGPGGQNVNKVETRVELLFDVAHSPSLSDGDRDKLLSHLRSHITDNGILQIISGESRSQWQNREKAIDRFIELLQKALKPQKKRVKTKVSHGVKQKRLELKKRRGDIKRLRRVRED